LTACAFCGRENDPASRFCIDCGKPMTASAARAGPPYQSYTSAAMGALVSSPSEESMPPIPKKPAAVSGAPIPPTRIAPVPGVPGGGGCPRCAKMVDPSLPFCGHCGAKVTASTATSECAGCGASYTEGVDVFCARCGQRVGKRVSMQVNSVGTPAAAAKSPDLGPRIALLDENGDVKTTYTLDRGDAVLGRGDADIKFDDVYLSPLHARLELRDGELWIRDLGSRNGTWTFIEQPTKLSDGDVVLVGSQLLRFRRLGYPGPHPPEADSTRRMGSLTPSADVAVLEQLRADASVRDTFHLSPARTVLMGRESGDWVFPYDQTMSGRHAEIRSQDAEFYVHDAGSRNGVALAVRGERAVRIGQRILLGDQVLRIESIGP
jgi:pSer/pThr/pTyr-binding forkhead associated (FHA) protein